MSDSKEIEIDGAVVLFVWKSEYSCPSPFPDILYLLKLNSHAILDQQNYYFLSVRSHSHALSTDLHTSKKTRWGYGHSSSNSYSFTRLYEITPGVT